MSVPLPPLCPTTWGSQLSFYQQQSKRVEDIARELEAKTQGPRSALVDELAHRALLVASGGLESALALWSLEKSYNPEQLRACQAAIREADDRASGICKRALAIKPQDEGIVRIESLQPAAQRALRQIQWRLAAPSDPSSWAWDKALEKLKEQTDRAEKLGEEFTRGKISGYALHTLPLAALACLHDAIGLLNPQMGYTDKQLHVCHVKTLEAITHASRLFEMTPSDVRGFYERSYRQYLSELQSQKEEIIAQRSARYALSV